jgi:hypothetical protein
MRDLSRDSGQLAIGGTVHTFLDNVVIESVQNVTRRWHSPVRKTDQPVIRNDRDSEHILYSTYSNHCVLKDEQDGLFKCWYEDLEGPLPNIRHHWGMFSRQL